MCGYLAYRFLVDQKEWLFLNRIFNVNYSESFDDSDKYVRHSQPMFHDESNVELIIRDAYQHPCEVGVFDPEYGLCCVNRAVG
ncbi:MAG: hypothetical protein P4M11_03030 [Candidatus Pacebacteria bacterium]|nr:hypothetical protein [Candidatus Paceibacterota bacterium]